MIRPLIAQPGAKASVSTQPLSSLRVIDLSDEHGAYCTKLLADLGADVIRVEPPSGDPLRAWRWPSAEPSVGSPFFEYYHANKRGVTLDVEHPEVLPLLEALVGSADVAVVSGPGTSIRAAIEAVKDSPLIVADLTSYGAEGPHSTFRATHLTTYAMSGLMINQGEAGSAPVVIPGVQMYDTAGVQAAFGILVALVSGGGGGAEQVAVATHEVLASQMHHLTRYGQFGVIPPRVAGRATPPSGTWQLSDGVISLQVWEPRQWDNFVKLLGSPAELLPPSLADRVARVTEAHWLESYLTTVLAEYRVEEFVESANAAGVPCSRFNHAIDLWNDPQLRARDFFRTPPSSEAAADELPGPPYRLPDGWWELRRPAPKLGQHNREVFSGELGFAESDLSRWGSIGVI